MTTERRESWPPFSQRGASKCVRGPPGRGATRLAPATRPLRFFTRHESRNTDHGFYVFHESRNTAFKSIRFAGGAQGLENKKPETDARTTAPADKSRLPYPPFPTISRHYSGGGGVPRSKCSSAVSWEIPQKCTESRFSQENVRSAAFAAAPVALRAASATANAQ